jgi:hypothetical protein
MNLPSFENRIKREKAVATKIRNENRLEGLRRNDQRVASRNRRLKAEKEAKEAKFDIKGN